MIFHAHQYGNEFPHHMECLKGFYVVVMVWSRAAMKRKRKMLKRVEKFNQESYEQSSYHQRVPLRNIFWNQLILSLFTRIPLILFTFSALFHFKIYSSAFYIHFIVATSPACLLFVDDQQKLSKWTFYSQRRSMNSLWLHINLE